MNGMSFSEDGGYLLIGWACHPTELHQNSSRADWFCSKSFALRIQIFSVRENVFIVCPLPGRFFVMYLINKDETEHTGQVILEKSSCFSTTEHI